MEIYTANKRKIARWFIFGIAALVFAGDLYLVLSNNISFIDKPVMDFCLALRDNTLTIIAKCITFMADPMTMLGICVILVILPTRSKFGLPLGVATGLAALCHTGVKILIDRPRPAHTYWLVNVNDASFPSGHSNIAVVFYIFLMILLYRYLRINKNNGAAVLIAIVLPMIVAAVCASRLYLGVHYASDVIGGIAMGTCLLVIFLTIYEAVWPVGLQFTGAKPEWGDIEKQRDWRRPNVKPGNEELIQFPSTREPWKRPNTTAKRRAAEQRAEGDSGKSSAD